ncbi:carboxypeptidase Y inhibitor [Thelonectria olida]|uniref:Carboxypeptidase Y inhibitor n=1 Tax=Thelonectria olida TaxID=1576542 RepID=A0A9P8VQX8_9HYPO|nr:carboxypeptidase Y inhibitor [Thelonectria olida]
MLYATIWKALALLPLAQLVTAGREEQRIMDPGNDYMSHIRQKLEDAEIIPTVVDDFTPILVLDAKWKSDSASLGNTLNPADLQSPPSVHLVKPESQLHSDIKVAPGSTFVLTLTDPDAPSRDNPKWSEFCHWIATGVSLSSSSEDSGHHLQDIIKYKPPGPPPKTGKHRYVFLVFVLANGTTDKLHLTKPEGRKHWGSDHTGHGVREWAHENGLIPVAANFIYAQNDEQ